MDYVIYLAISALILPFSGIYGSITIQECQSNRLDINERENSQIHCTNLASADTVWYIGTSPNSTGQYNFVEIGRCPPFATSRSCTTTRNDTTFSRTENSSTMIIRRNHRYFGGKSLKCSADATSGGYICPIRVIHYEQPAECRFFVHPDKTVSGSCYTEMWFSSDNGYSCKWTYASTGTAGSSSIGLDTVLIKTVIAESELRYYRATCAFSVQMTDDGTYSFYMAFNPGPAEGFVGSVTIPLKGEQQPVSQPLTITYGSLPSLDMTCAGFPVTHNIKWTGVTCDSSTNDGTCAFVPTGAEYDGREVTCSATFRKSGQTVNATFKLSFIPPTLALTNSTPHTTSTIGLTTVSSAGNRRGNNSKTTSNSGVAAIAGGVAGAVVVIIIVIVVVVVVVVIVRRRKELEEHVNTLYEPGPDPYEINDIHQPTSRHYTTQTQPALDTVDPTYEDHNLDSYDDGYAAVRTGSPQGNRSFLQTHRPSLDHDLYSDVDVPIPKPAGAVSGPATQGDEYAVVDKSRKRNTEPTFQPDVYAQVNKLRPKTGGDVYAQVNKPAKRANTSQLQHDIDEGDGNYGEVQKPKPDLKPKPTLKSKPTAAVKPNPKDTSDPVKTSGGDDEYNVLTFHLRNSDTPTNPDAGQLYSHIGTVSDTMATP